MPEPMVENLRSGALWSEFCDALKLAGEQVLAQGVPDDELTRAEGFRYLTRLLRLSLEKHIEFGDPDFPQFYSLSHETAKIGNDNPDNYYQNCAVDGRHEYRIRGNRGSVAYLSIESKAGEQYPNWLTTAGHRVGAMLLRYVEAEDYPPVDTRVLSFAQLKTRSEND